MSYTLPAVGTVLPPKENANPEILNPGPTGNSLAYNEWLQAVVQDVALQQNKSAAQFYQSSLFPGWLVMIPILHPPHTARSVKYALQASLSTPARSRATR